MTSKGGDRSVTARDIVGASVVTGDHNKVVTQASEIALPQANAVDVKAELAGLRDALADLKNVPDRRKLDRAVEDAADEVAKPEPDKDEVGGALQRVVKYAKAASDFDEQAEKLLPRLAALASWAGANWQSLIGMIGGS